MTKPAIVSARWANVGGAELLSPSSGLRDTGFVSSTLAEPGYVNYMFNQFYLWEKWLDDNFSTNDVAFHHSAWTGTDGSATVIVQSSAAYATLSASGNFYTPIVVPVGRTLLNATFY